MYFPNSTILDKREVKKSNVFWRISGNFFARKVEVSVPNFHFSSSSMYMTNKPGRTNQRTKKLTDEPILRWTRPGGKVWLSVSLRHRMLKRLWLFSKTKKTYYRCPNPVYFNSPLLMLSLSAIETPSCPTEIEFNRVYFIRFCTTYHTWFSKNAYWTQSGIVFTHATNMEACFGGGIWCISVIHENQASHKTILDP